MLTKLHIKQTKEEKFCKVNGVDILTDGINIKIERGFAYATITIPTDNIEVEMDNVDIPEIKEEGGNCNR